MQGFSPHVSAVRSDHHDDGPGGHAGGRAIDFSSVNGVPVGVNRETVQFVAAAIRARARQVGTLPELANIPELQALAHQFGVELIADPGTGPHVHVGI